MARTDTTVFPAPGAAMRNAGQPRDHRRRGWQRIRQIRRTILVLALSLLFLFPVLTMVSTAFKLPGDVFHAPPTLLPADWTLVNFTKAFEDIPVWRYLGNTLLISAISMAGTIISCPLVAYSLSKIKWAGAKPLLILVLATMMLPPQVTMIPVFLIWNDLGLVDSYLPLVVPTFLGVPFFIFLIRQFLLSVPDELIEAARIDGASELRTYATIVLPIARPAIVTAAMFQFIWAWVDFLNPLIYLNDPDKYTLSIGIYAFFGQNTADWGPLMAACVLFALPALALFLIGQRFLIGGISTGAIK